MEQGKDRRSVVGGVDFACGLTCGNLTAICMALNMECKIGMARRSGNETNHAPVPHPSFVP
jgi:hypothetical protein